MDVGDSAEKFKVTFSVVSNPGSTESPDTGTETDEPAIPEGGTQIGSATLSADNNWFHTFRNLPLSGVDADGNSVTYSYYVVEDPVSGYDTTYENNGGIQSGTITVINKKQDTPETPSYELPETGGAGTSLFTMGGAALAALSLLLGTRQRRRGERRVRH